MPENIDISNMNTKRTAIDCVRENCRFKLVDERKQNKNLKNVCRFMENTKNLYVCLEHLVLHICNVNKSSNICVFLSKKLSFCPISEIKGNGEVLHSTVKENQGLPLASMHADYWKQILSEYNFSMTLHNFVKQENLPCDSHVLNSIIQRLHCLFIIYHKMDTEKSKYSEEIKFSNCKTRMCLIQEALSEHFSHKISQVSTGQRLADAKFLKHASRLIAHDLLVPKTHLLPFKHLVNQYTNKPLRKRIFERSRLIAYWRTAPRKTLC